MELPESRSLAGELPGLRRVAHVAGRAPRPIRNSPGSEEGDPGVPRVSGKTGPAVPSD